MIIKPATDLSEFLQIHQLNYIVFVEEIPQHTRNAEKVLIDKFHATNNYIIAKNNEQVIGMVCYNHTRPFSLDSKIKDLESYLPSSKKLAEIRLLSISASERKPMVAYKLLKYLCKVLVDLGTDVAIISGTTRQIKLYEAIGFVHFGELVGTGEALFQPMYITLKNLRNDFMH